MKRYLGNAPVKNPAQAFPVGKLVEAKIKSIGTKKSALSLISHFLLLFSIHFLLRVVGLVGSLSSLYHQSENEPKVELTLKTNEARKPLVFGDLQEGMKVKGAVKSVKDKSLLIRLRNSKNLTGMCHISELSEDFVEDPSKYYKEGDQVKALIIKLDPERQRFNLSLKPSHFEGDVDSSDEEKQPKKKRSKKAKKVPSSPLPSPVVNRLSLT
jgi:transcriptional accessory protein Tex/SPT6